MDSASFALTETQREFRSSVRQLAEARIARHAPALEPPSRGVPSAYGGAGADHVTQAVMVEELARACASTSVTLLISKLSMIPVMNWGSDELKAKYLPQVASGA